MSHPTALKKITAYLENHIIRKSLLLNCFGSSADEEV